MNKKERKDKNFVFTAIVTGIVILIIWYLNYFLLKNNTNKGVIGDMFGAVNSLFSGLALAGIILTILLQRQELILQRQELSDTREEFKTQNQTLKLQRFENTFFSLLKLHYDIINDIDFRYYKRKETTSRMSDVFRTKEEDKEVVDLKGRDVFRFRYNKMAEEMRQNNSNYIAVYLKHYQEAQTDFGHYFRNLYRMIKMVNNADFEIELNDPRLYETKYQYTSIIRAQLSDYELLWIFYNCLSENGDEKFKPLIEEYTLFKNIPLNLLADKSHSEEYNEYAYRKK